MATLATGLPATALTGLDLHQLDSNKRFRHLIMVPPLPRFPSATSHFVTSMTAPIASGWSNIAGWASHPLRNAAFARRTPKCDIPAIVRKIPKAFTTHEFACATEKGVS